jgi:anaerobic selenocysteine-containing dehydrogenase
MADAEIIKSTCGLCLNSCGVIVSLQDGRAVEIQGDPDSPNSKGGLCPIGLASLEYLYSEKRLKHPLKRTGERGQGEWRQISWDEALSQIADKLNRLKHDYGAESVAFIHGSAKGYQDTLLRRLANAFGTPNLANADNVCHIPRMLGAQTTLGFFPGADYGYPPACIVLWGTNKAETGFWVSNNYMKAVDRGAKLIVIDPLKTQAAQKADLWVQLRPGTDLALALGMIHVIIKEGLFDKDFVEKWVFGFDKLEAHVQDYTPEKVSQITWLDAEKIINVSRLYATNRPAKILMGNALDQTINAYQSSRAVAILMAITGNIGIPGGEIETAGGGYRKGEKESSGTGMLGNWSPELELREDLPEDKKQKKVGADLNLFSDFRFALPQDIIRAILDGNPYPIRAAYVQDANPLTSWIDTGGTYEAFKKLDFLVVSDMFLTPTAVLADIVLPTASYLEYDGIALPPAGGLAQTQRKVAQIGECRSEHEILNELGKRLGLSKYFWNSIDDFWDAILEPIGLSFEEFKQIRRISGVKQYRKYRRGGFNTPSGKIEVYSSELERQGLDPLPVYREPPDTPYSDPELAKEYPLILTSRKVSPYRHSGGRQISSLRGIHPEPVAIIHPETAANLGIEDGDWIYIENKKGRVKQKASLFDGVDPRVIFADYGWWFPERKGDKLFGVMESNINMLTSSQQPFGAELGTANLRGISCKVYKAPAQGIDRTTSNTK